MLKVTKEDNKMQLGDGVGAGMWEYQNDLNGNEHEKKANTENIVGK